VTKAPTGIGATSLGVAWLRAAETGRDDRLFDDPYAQYFVTAAAESPTVPTQRSGQGTDFYDLMAGQVALRTRFLDDALLDFAADTAAQVVLLACGMDTRAFRLAWPTGTRVFEVDLPETLAFKDAVLTAHGAVASCDRKTVAADLRDDWPPALAAGGGRRWCLRCGSPRASGMRSARTPQTFCCDALRRIRRAAACWPSTTTRTRITCAPRGRPSRPNLSTCGRRTGRRARRMVAPSRVAATTARHR
jgi:hypothetical protein